MARKGDGVEEGEGVEAGGRRGRVGGEVAVGVRVRGGGSLG